MNKLELAQKMNKIIAKCWLDDSFKQKLLAHPEATIKTELKELPTGITFVMHEDTDSVMNITIPAKPTDISDEELESECDVNSCCCYICIL